MTTPEASHFARLLKSEGISFFRIAQCKNVECKAEIPKGKKFCTVACHNKYNGIEEEDDEDEYFDE